MMGWINLNSFFGIKYTKDRRNLKRYFFTDEDLSTIMNNANTYYDFYLVLVNTGIRSTDAYSLRPEHIRGNYLVKQMNKTGDWLNIPLPENTKKILYQRIDGEFMFEELQTPFQRRKYTEHLQPNF